MNRTRGVRRQWMRNFVFCLAVLVSHQALADGGLIRSIGVELSLETQQRALLHAQHMYGNGPDDYAIDLYLDVAYEGEGGDFAWVVPTPSLPEVSLVEAGFFDELDELTRPIVYYIAGTPSPWGCAMAGGGAPRQIGDVVVWGTDTIGPYEYAILTAGGPSGLVTWLEDNGYVLPLGADTVLDYYIDRQSYFVAFRLSPNASAGPLSAIKLTYGADEIVYPLRITSLSAAEETYLTLYVMGCCGVDPVNATVTHVDRSRLTVDPDTLTSNYEDLFTEAVSGCDGLVLVREAEIDFGYYQYDVENSQLHALLLSSEPCNWMVRFRTILSVDHMAEDIAFHWRSNEELVTAIYVKRHASKVGIHAVAALPVLLVLPKRFRNPGTGKRRFSLALTISMLLLLTIG